MLPEPKVYHLSLEEAKIMEVFRRAKKERFANLNIKIHNGLASALDWTHKVDLLEKEARPNENANLA